MKQIKSRKKYSIFLLPLLLGYFLIACEFPIEPDYIPNNTEFYMYLSEYDLFEGNMSELNPNQGVYVYELSTQLFTDYAEKQRLVKLPEGQQMRLMGNDLLDFPEGTLLVKTFYYFNNAQYPNADKRILETRLILKHNGKWNVAVYKWNNEQTEAELVKEGLTVDVEWTRENGELKRIKYEIPSHAECTTCHQSSGNTVPIGLKAYNMNRIINVNGDQINQLEHFQNEEILERSDLSQLISIPDWSDQDESLTNRARAYFDVNCSHCHNPDGFAGNKRLRLEYTRPFSETRIGDLKNNILNRMSSNWNDERMPLIGTTIKHKEGIELVKTYLESF